MSRLLSADYIIVFEHFFKHISVAYRRFLNIDTVLFGKFPKAHICHYRHNRRIVFKLAAFFHVEGGNGDKNISVYKIAVTVHRKTPVGVSVKGKTYIHSVRLDKGFKRLHVGRAAFVVYVYSVGMIVYDRHLGAKPFVKLFGTHRRRAVGTVQRHLHTVETDIHSGNNVIYIILNGIRHFYYPPDIFADGMRPVINSALHKLLDLVLKLVGKLKPRSAEQLDSVVFAGIVRGRNHNACVGLVFFDKVGDRGGGHGTDSEYIGSHRANSGGQRRFEHLRGNSRILSDEYFRAAFPRSRKHNRRRTAYFHGQLAGKLAVGNSSCPVCSKKSWHSSFLRSLSVCFAPRGKGLPVKAKALFAGNFSPLPGALRAVRTVLYI